MLKITTPSRLHLTLIDMNASRGRVDGSIGLTLDKPVISIDAETSDTIEITGNSEHLERMRNSALMLLPEGAGVHISIGEEYPSHIGLGSGTQASLAAGMAVNRLYSLGLSVYEVARRIGRGGTSGIGVAAFESGGFILDCGHRFSDKKDFLPSSASRLPPAPVLLRNDFPDWDILIAIPDQRGASREKEISIFQRECPVPLREVEELSHIILMQLLPALAEEDIVTFGSSINAIQDTGFKKKEIELQPVSRELMYMLRDQGAYGAGMSSFGPAVYAFGEDADNLRRIAGEFIDGKGEVFITKARNEGARIESR
ncbi:putative sugar kinase [Candidatus Methanoperedens nitroreducens]|uniref:Beta-ribofuranosylaminobenzene 5'-phosphate synthase n=1 Tax=Candidatus Methanoperedens nitratireducens TaxID=1392998 RepID=A0A062V3E4_9EURY|nr:beta-ribofuranosylaminobenzene 5'-phosphate synthase [Candidatus Methanoperedens nitroreducens]KCZ70339.1 putative sugar kinase [Candidatus Methanoperedens nitroreducens]MDJ1421376.1 beta-ribofuranosylaminobenzene 5'-phosphate synthase [Candidatus Methanoperedens sp.]